MHLTSCTAGLHPVVVEGTGSQARELHFVQHRIRVANDRRGVYALRTRALRVAKISRFANMYHAINVGICLPHDHDTRFSGGLEPGPGLNGGGESRGEKEGKEHDKRDPNWSRGQPHDTSFM